MDRDKILKMVVILAAVVVIASSFSKYLRRDSMSLSEYAKLNGISDPHLEEENSASPSLSPSSEVEESIQEDTLRQTPDPAMPEKTDGLPSSPAPDETAPFLPSPSQLSGASLNGSSQLEQRVSLEEGFYYEPLSVQLCRYITGISYPVFNDEEEDAIPEIMLDELRYVHILHYDFEGMPTEGELICNESIAQDLAEIFYELYRNEYRLEKVLLIDEYDGDDNASMEDNNTSCFNYRPVTGSSHLSKHALGLAIDINPLYNPYITYTDSGEENVLPASGSAYADRTRNFAYKIDENDLCYKLFIQHGFTWGGNWNSMKDYQHFQKAQ